MSNNISPSVSVVIPVYNGTNYLCEAIDSVLNQTYNHYEIIVVDDGSTDETWALIQSYGSKVRGIRQENRGVAGALNHGIRASSSDYVAWLSHDDLFLPAKLQCQIEFLLQNKQFSACYTDYHIIDQSGGILRTITSPWYPREQAMWVLFGRMYINGSTMLIERNCFEKVGWFSEEWRYTQDAEMWLRILRHFSIGRVPEKLGKLRFHSAQQGSIHVEKHNAEKQAMFKKVFCNFIADGIFPIDRAMTKTAEKMACAYEWFGDSMRIYRRMFDFADEQYVQSLALWPSWKNKARIKRVLNYVQRVLIPYYHFIRRIIGSVFRRFWVG